MAYPEPNPDSSRERLYKEATFFYREYERVKAQNGRLRKALDSAPPAMRPEDAVQDPVRSMAWWQEYVDWLTKAREAEA